ncbi:optic atrophy 3 protein-domain-containing protein [Ochromonadaceae sp. CCMP2298]|nr:optic atrophy 3 protein-domain-containing protein [Ochromonadaceae sp. CCMP2298]|mmetsp:Transcript_31683/g.69800  ORF Transcript_31683/g.69800 Transcript_31683/m.69800 type:complete len:174 (+) Transcript_31683:197-718(+)
MAPLPMLKIAALALRTISKPLAARLMKQTKSHPLVSRICAIAGEYAHQITSRINIMASGYKVVTVKPLPKEDALNDGVGVISEVLVFSFAGFLVAYEYKITEDEKAMKSAKAAQIEADYKQSLQDRFDSLEKNIAVLTDGLQKIEQSVQKQTAQGPAKDQRKQASLFDWFQKP